MANCFGCGTQETTDARTTLSECPECHRWYCAHDMAEHRRNETRARLARDRRDHTKITEYGK